MKIRYFFIIVASFISFNIVAMKEQDTNTQNPLEEMKNLVTVLKNDPSQVTQTKLNQLKVYADILNYTLSCELYQNDNTQIIVTKINRIHDFLDQQKKYFWYNEEALALNDLFKKPKVAAE